MVVPGLAGVEFPFEELPQPRTVVPTIRQNVAVRTLSRQRQRGRSPSKSNTAKANTDFPPAPAFIAVVFAAVIVLIVTVLEPGEFAVSCNDAGFREQAGGSLAVPVPRYFTAQLRATGPARPPTEAI